MTEEAEQIKVCEIFNNGDEYVIPIYQRAYAWDDNEIITLIDDINHHTKDSPYHLGSLVVHMNTNQGSDNVFEVIDGQQRLTTLYLIMCALYRRRKDVKLPDVGSLKFDCRDSSNDILSALAGTTYTKEIFFRDGVNNSLIQGYQYIEKKLDDIKNFANGQHNKDNVSEFVERLDKTDIFRIELPEHTDLNHYFEIMNTRGVQLEMYQVVKARCMSELDRLEKDSKAVHTFSRIWDACSDMTRYIQSSFTSEERKHIFGKKWDCIQNDITFDKLSDILGESVDSCESESHSIENILESNAAQVQMNESKDIQTNDDGRFTSIIDFPNFLLQVLKLYYQEKQDKKKDVPLDDSKLLDCFNNTAISSLDIEDFGLFLLKARFAFDVCIIKSDSHADHADDQSNWVLYRAQKADNKKELTTSSAFKIDDSSAQNMDFTAEIIKLQSMNQVTDSRNTYKNFLQNYLQILDKLDVIEHPKKIFEGDFSHKFCKILRKHAFERFKREVCPEDLSTVLDDAYHHLPRYVFNFTDYLLWKYRPQAHNIGASDDQLISAVNEVWKCSKDVSNSVKNYRFRYRNSIEHFYPQQPEGGRTVPKNINCFGNLCLMNRSENSRRTNLMPEAKVRQFDANPRFSNQSLKFQLMASIVRSDHNKWDENQIEEHNKKLRAILSAALQKTNWQNA